jgi:hypothetical protein
MAHTCATWRTSNTGEQSCPQAPHVSALALFRDVVWHTPATVFGTRRCIARAVQTGAPTGRPTHERANGATLPARLLPAWQLVAEVVTRLVAATSLRRISMRPRHCASAVRSAICMGSTWRCVRSWGRLTHSVLLTATTATIRSRTNGRSDAAAHMLFQLHREKHHEARTHAQRQLARRQRVCAEDRLRDW